MGALEQLRARFRNIVPIVSECTAATDTRFGKAHDLMREMERICDRRVIATIEAAEPIGPKKLLDLLVIAPCTGNTLGKLAAGITDTSVTMAAKASAQRPPPPHRFVHQRCSFHIRPQYWGTAQPEKRLFCPLWTG